MATPRSRTDGRPTATAAPTETGDADGLAAIKRAEDSPDSAVAALARKLRAAAGQDPAPSVSPPVRTPAPAAAPRTPSESRVFVSPRVVDQRAFSELAGELRSLIADAAAQRDALSGAEKTVETIQAGLQHASVELRQRLERASKLAPTIDHKLTESESRLSRATELVDRAEALEPKLEAMIRERLDNAAAVAEERITALENRLAAAERRADEAEQRAAAASDVLSNARREHEDAASALVAASLNEMDERLAAMSAQVDGFVDRASDAVGRSLAEIEAGVEQAQASIERIAGRGIPTTTELDGLCERAERLIGVGEAGTEQGEPRADSLAGAAARAEAIASHIDATRTALDQATKQADESRTHLGHALIAAAERMKNLSEEERELASRVEQARSQADDARGALDERSTELRELLDAPVRQIGAQVEQAGRWLGEIIRHADERGRALSELLEAHAPKPVDDQPPAAADDTARETKAVERDASGRFRRVS